MANSYTVINRETGATLTDAQILEEINRDRSEEWTEYTLQDLHEAPYEVTGWLDTTYYEARVDRG